MFWLLSVFFNPRMVQIPAQLLANQIVQNVFYSPCMTMRIYCPNRSVLNVLYNPRRTLRTCWLGWSAGVSGALSLDWPESTLMWASTGQLPVKDPILNFSAQTWTLNFLLKLFALQELDWGKRKIEYQLPINFLKDRIPALSKIVHDILDIRWT